MLVNFYVLILLMPRELIRRGLHLIFPVSCISIHHEHVYLTRSSFWARIFCQLRLHPPNGRSQRQTNSMSFVYVLGPSSAEVNEGSPSVRRRTTLSELANGIIQGIRS
jgi:hypothetical protein